MRMRVYWCVCVRVRVSACMCVYVRAGVYAHVCTHKFFLIIVYLKAKTFTRTAKPIRLELEEETTATV